MSTFSDFALIASVPSYGGAEILRAQRVLPMGPGPRVHLALFGRSDSVMRRVVYAANAAAAILHSAIARIYEVARFDGVVYGVGDPSEGLDLAALLNQKKPVPMDLALGVVASCARVAVAVHDAAGPGSFNGAPMGLGSVLSGGLCPEGVFLEQSGAVRLRPLATAGIDPNVPSAFRAPEEAISMPADVYGIGRLLAALLSGDPTGRQLPRVSSPQVSALLTRMVHQSPSERPHLHEATTKLEGALRELRVASADQAVRAALMGPYRPMVVDPVLSFGAPPHVVDQLRMQLPYIYGAVERLWPSMAPSGGGSLALPPPPPAFAALPPVQSDEGPAVFTDARPAVRRQKVKTPATVIFGQADLADAVRAVSEEGAAFKPKTSPTMIIPTAELRKALPAPGARLEEDDDDAPKTKMIDPSTFTPFTPPPAATPSPTPALAPAPPSVATDRPATPARAAPPPPMVTSPSMPVVRPNTSSSTQPKRPATNAAMNVFSGSPPPKDSGEDEDHTQMLDDRSDLVARLRAKEKADDEAALRAAARAAIEEDDVFSSSEVSDEEVSGFSSSAPARSGGRSGPTPPPSPPAERPRAMPPPPAISTSVAPPPEWSDPAGAPQTDAVAAANADTALARQEPANDRDRKRPAAARRSPGLPTFSPSASDISDAFSATFAPSPNAAPPADAAATMYDDDSGSAPQVIDDAGHFVMVGDSGQTFEGDKNPFKAPTRFYPTQALQAARSASESNPEGDVNDSDSGFNDASASIEIRAPRTTDSDEGDPKTDLVDPAALSSELARAEASQAQRRSPPATMSREGPPQTGKHPPAPNSETQRVVRPQATSTQVSPPPLEAPRREQTVATAPQSSRASHLEVGAMSQLIVEAPAGATVMLNGTAIGNGPTTVDVAPTSRCVVKVTLAGHAPFSTVVMVGGKPRVRVKPVLKPR